MTDKQKINPVNYITDIITFSYAHVFEPKLNPSQKLKYSACLLLSKDNPAEKAKWDAAIEAAIQNGIAKGNFTANQRPILKMPIRDGDQEIKVGARKPGQGYEGNWFVNANSDDPPGVTKPANNMAIAITDPLEFYSGCKGRAIISFYPYGGGDIKSRGIAVGLNGCYKTGDGTRMDGRVDASSVFNQFAEQDGDLEDNGGGNEPANDFE